MPCPVNAPTVVNSIEMEALVLGNFKGDDAEDILEDIEKVSIDTNHINFLGDVGYYAASRGVLLLPTKNLVGAKTNVSCPCFREGRFG